MMQRVVLPAILVFLLVAAAGATAAVAQSWTATNPTGREYRREPLRLKVAVPANAKTGDYVVKADGEEVPAQVGERDGRRYLWVLADVPPQGAVRYEAARGRPKDFRGDVKVERQGDSLVLSNGAIAVRVPAEINRALGGPIEAVRLPGGRWVGKTIWNTQRQLARFSAEVLGEGPVFAHVRLRYQFEGASGLWGNVPSFATVDLRLVAGQQHLLVEEAHEMDRRDYWEFDAAAGWPARSAVVVTFGTMPAHGGPAVKSPDSLRVGQTRMGDTLVNLQPRWTQSYDEGWHFLCHDGREAVGAIPVFAGRWHWPHDNLIEVKVKPSADYAGLRAPTWKGRRAWLLLVGPKALWENEAAAKQYVTAHAFQPLDKLQHDYVLEWPGLERLLAEGSGTPNLGSFTGIDFYSSAMNPTSMLRGYGRRLAAEAGRQGNLSDLTQCQVFLDDDAFGSYWNYWSPENPNFFTDFHKVSYALATRLKRHPRFAEFARRCEQTFLADLHHSITLPGGAGQECPGYVAYAMGHWAELAEMCKQHLGFDVTRSPRYRAGASFLVRLSVPISPTERRCHPGGDTHPPGPDVFALAAKFGVREDISRLKTEELPGFGAVFRNQPGTDRETYLSFKSGPNRGHYHGDQLSFHYCADARPVAIDHMCSYSPRAGQEHMHNRVAFFTDKLPWANMDGYERLIAFKTSADCDVAIGQVESDRLRITTEFPPEEWDTYLPEQRFEVPLRYRRTIVLVKNRGKDYFVIRDQHDGPAVKAAYCLHVQTDRVRQRGPLFEFGNLTLFCATPEQVAVSRHDWSHERKDRDGKVTFREATIGLRLATEGAATEFITVLYPGTSPPAIEALEGGVRVGGDEILFAGGIDEDPAVSYVVVRRDAKSLVQLTGKEIDLDRFQGDVGLFVPDAGYPFGDIPDWLIRQRSAVPDWAPPSAREARRYELKP